MRSYHTESSPVRMRLSVLFLLLFVLLPAFSYCRAIPQHRRGWGTELDVREKAVQQFLKHSKGSPEELPPDLEKGSGLFQNGFDDNEPGDSDEEGNEKELTLQTTKKTSGCVHPKTQHIIEIGSFDFDEMSCMMCECPSGKLKCYKTC